MTDNELLLAISDMMDTKLKSELQPIRHEMRVFKNEVQNELKAIKTELHSEIQAVSTELRAEIREVNEGLHTEIQEVKTDVRGLKHEVHYIRLYQENIILPRLNTIEACYTDTYRRYASYTEKIEAVLEDVRVLKSVVTEHSEKLRKMA